MRATRLRARAHFRLPSVSLCWAESFVGFVAGRRRMKRTVFALLVGGALLGRASSARADEEPPHKYLGLGYKIGNGMGFVGGDVIISPIDHLTLDIQANYLSIGVTGGGTATGYGLAPTLQGHLLSGRGSSPYLGAGALYATMSMNGVTASTSGVVANAGYEWRWASGLGILLGGGFAYLGNVHATDGVTTVDSPGGSHFNIEAGLRYMFM